MSYESAKKAIEDRAAEIEAELGVPQVIGYNAKEQALHLEIDAEIARLNLALGAKYAELTAEQKANELTKLAEKVLPGLLELLHVLKSI